MELKATGRLINRLLVNRYENVLDRKRENILYVESLLLILCEGGHGSETLVIFF